MVALVLSEAVQGQISRLSRHGLLPTMVLEAIENDDDDAIQEYIKQSAAARV